MWRRKDPLPEQTVNKNKKSPPDGGLFIINSSSVIRASLKAAAKAGMD